MFHFKLSMPHSPSQGDRVGEKEDIFWQHDATLNYIWSELEQKKKIHHLSRLRSKKVKEEIN